MPLNAGFTCPNIDGTIGTGGCAYCNNVSFSPVAEIKIPVEEQLENGISSLVAHNKNAEEIGILAYFQSFTNTYAPAPVLKEIFTPVLKNQTVAGIAIGTRPDCLPKETLSLLAELNEIKPVIVEIGVQSANDKTLKYINRGHTAECTRNVAALCKNLDLAITAHIIIGLPNETASDFQNTARLIKDCGFSAVKIHPLHIVKNTRFAKEYAEGKIKLLTMEEYCRAVAGVIEILSPEVAIDRVSGESSSDLLIAPSWSGNREAIKSFLFGI
ncbi:TIGR01212 family radical SAM protein [Fibrobacterales bacterium]|nr:TIGR01212 family radical SAM protein [Fibrobacterales bacterium]